MAYRAVVEAGKLANKQLEPLKRALMEKDRWASEAEQILNLKKQCKSLSDPKEWERYLAERLRHAYKLGGDDVRHAIRNVLQID